MRQGYAGTWCKNYFTYSFGLLLDVSFLPTNNFLLLWLAICCSLAAVHEHEGGGKELR